MYVLILIFSTPKKSIKTQGSGQPLHCQRCSVGVVIASNQKESNWCDSSPTVCLNLAQPEAQQSCFQHLANRKLRCHNRDAGSKHTWITCNTLRMHAAQQHYCMISFSGLCLMLGGVMASRFSESKKFMPAGLIATSSLLMSASYVVVGL